MSHSIDQNGPFIRHFYEARKPRATMVTVDEKCARTVCVLEARASVVMQI